MADALISVDLVTKADLVTKSDLGALETRSDAKFASLEAKFDSKIELPRRDVTIKLGGMLVIAVGVILTAMRFMPHP